MKEFKIDDEVEILMDNEIHKLKCCSINERKSCNIIEKNYWFDKENKEDNYRLSLTFTIVKDDK
jgi:hypothetical protein